MVRNTFFVLLLIVSTLTFAQILEEKSPFSAASPFAVDQSEESQKLNFKLYPNPLKGKILNIISSRQEMKNIVILNILGEVVFKINTPENQIQLPNLIDGIYIVKIRQGNYMGLSRLVVS